MVDRKVEADKGTKCLIDLVSMALTGKVFRNDHGEYTITEVYVGGSDPVMPEIKADIIYSHGEGIRTAPRVSLGHIAEDRFLRQ